MLPTETVSCPYCWEPIEILLDLADDAGQWTEDCQVCCRPILITVQPGSQGPTVSAEREND